MHVFCHTHIKNLLKEPAYLDKVVLDFSIYATKKELEHATGVDTPDLAAKKRFYCFES